MNKIGSSKGKKCAVSWESHPKNLLKNFCSLMEHQSLVDVVLSCGSNTIQAHKFVLAANSPLFREEFEKNPSIQQITISGCNFGVLKSVVEIMYCGHTLINESDMKFFIAIIRLFEMKYLENVFIDHAASKEEVTLPKPQFLTKKPKYPSFTYQTSGPAQNHPVAPSLVKTSDSTTPVTVTVVNGNDFSNAVNMVKPLTDFNVPLTEPLPIIPNFKSYARGKRTLKHQAEQACVKEAQASRLALASLQKEIAAAPQINSFIIEDTCAETTVENFIPHPETSSLVQVLNYNDLMNRNLENVLLMPMPIVQNQNSGFKQVLADSLNGVQIGKKSLAADKLKSILEGNASTNVEVMYKDADGNYVPVNEEVLQSLAAREGLQYQVIDEDGHVSELQEVQVIEKIDNLLHNVINAPPGNAICLTEAQKIEKNHQEVPKIGLDLPSLNEPSEISDQVLKFSPEIFFSDIGTDDGIQDEVTVVEADDIFVETSKSIKTE